MKWDSSTRDAQVHCSLFVGIFCCHCIRDSFKKKNFFERLETNILDLVLVEVRYPVNDEPRKSSSKVYHLVHHKGHDASGESIVLHIDIPGCP